MILRKSDPSVRVPAMAAHCGHESPHATLGLTTHLLTAFCVLLLGALANLMPGSAQGATLSVPADYASVQNAIDAAADGDIVLIAPGIYRGRLVIEDKAITLASWFYTTGNPDYIKQTVLDGQGGNEIVAYKKGSPGMNYFIGLSARNSAEDGLLVSSPLTLLFSRISDTRDAIDYESGADGSVVRASVIFENRDDAIDFDARSSGLVEHNLLINNKDDGIEIRLPGAIEATPPAYIIRNNIITGNGEDGVQIIGYGTGPSARTTIIEHNLIADNAMAGVALMCCDKTTEYYEGASHPERSLIHNNTFSNNNHGVVGGDNMIVLNNIFVGHEVAVKRLRANSVAAHNIFFSNAVNRLDAIEDPGTNLVADPRLNSDYSLQGGSPAIDAGIKDYNWKDAQALNLQPGDYTGSAPDQGAFEINGDNPYNMPPFVNAGADRQLPAPGAVELAAVTYDDGVTGQPLSITWLDAGNTGNVSFANASAATTSVSFNATGTFRIRVLVSDGEITSESELEVRVGSGAGNATGYPITSGGNDAEERTGDGSMELSSSDLEMTFDASGDRGEQIVGLRFTGIDIPAGTVITNAWIEFWADESDSEVTTLEIRGHATGNAPVFTTSRNNLSARALTQAAVEWSPAPWPQTGVTGPAQQTPDLTSIIQELIGHPDWATGNAMAILISGAGKRVAESYDKLADHAPRLHIQVAGAGANLSPVLTDVQPPNGTSFNTGETIEFSATATDHEDGNLAPAINWSSSLSGFLGTGNRVSTVLPAGSHVVTATVSDSMGASASASITVAVSEPNNDIPVVTIKLPDDNSSYVAGSTVFLSGEASDTEDGDRSAFISWSSSLDGPLGSGPVANAVLSVGSHTVSATVVDTAGQSADTSINVTVTAAPAPNADPVVEINAPNSGNTFTAGQPITFSGSASDAEDGDISATLQWSSSVVGELGSGSTVSAALPAGTHAVTAVASDSGNATGSAAIVIAVDPAPGSGEPAVIESRISASADDAEENSSGIVRMGSTDLELVREATRQLVGLRFANLNIAPGAVITAAWIQFTVDEVSSETTALILQGQASSNAETFSHTERDISSRPRTAAQTNWAPGPWTTEGAAGAEQRTPDLSGIVNEIVNGADWGSGNAIVFIVSGSGKRVAESFNGHGGGAPLLHIEYTVSGGNQAPQVNAGADMILELPETSLPLKPTVPDDSLLYVTAVASEPALSFQWEHIGGTGAGTVTFADSTSAATMVTITPDPGTYILRLTADDGELSQFDDVIITVIGGRSIASIQPIGYFDTGFANANSPLAIPAIDPAGVVFHPPTGRLFIVDSEINEVPKAFDIIQANLFSTSADGSTTFAQWDLTESTNAEIKPNNEPTGIAYCASDEHFYISNDDTRKIYRYSFDGFDFVAVDAFSTSGLNDDPEGMSCDPRTGRLYVIGGTEPSVVILRYNDGFVLEDAYELRDTAGSRSYVPIDAKGIAFDPASRHLFILSSRDKAIFEYTLAGSYVKKLSIQDILPKKHKAQGLSIGISTDNSQTESFFIADGLKDNDSDARERDGRIYELRIIREP
jgi:hypothetical protein